MIKWNEVTWYSRLGAIILFVGVVPVLSFYIGTQYESVKREQSKIEMVQPSTEAVSQQRNSILESEPSEASSTVGYTKTPNLSDSNMTTTTSNGEIFYTPPYLPLTPTDEITSVAATGVDGMYTKDDAILAAKRKGFFKGQLVGRIPGMIKLIPSINSGEGDAWFVEDSDYHASTATCTTRSNYIRATFEMNAKTGRIVILNKCGFAIFD